MMYFGIYDYKLYYAIKICKHRGFAIQNLFSKIDYKIYYYFRLYLLKYNLIYI